MQTTLAQPLAGTEGATLPFWSPAGHSIGFFADSKLKLLDIGGGKPRALASAIFGSGGAWNRDGTILFAPTAIEAIYRIPAAGGNAERSPMSSDLGKQRIIRRSGCRTAAAFCTLQKVLPKAAASTSVFPLCKRRSTSEGHISPDGQWLAYQSNESGRFEIYVQRFPAPAGKLTVSTTGGAQPL